MHVARPGARGYRSKKINTRVNRKLATEDRKTWGRQETHNRGVDCQFAMPVLITIHQLGNIHPLLTGAIALMKHRCPARHVRTADTAPGKYVSKDSLLYAWVRD